MWRMTPGTVLDGGLDRTGKPGGQAAALGGEVLAERIGDLAEVTVDDPQPGRLIDHR